MQFVKLNASTAEIAAALRRYASARYASSDGGSGGGGGGGGGDGNRNASSGRRAELDGGTRLYLSLERGRDRTSHQMGADSSLDGRTRLCIGISTAFQTVFLGPGLADELDDAARQAALAARARGLTRLLCYPHQSLRLRLTRIPAYGSPDSPPAPHQAALAHEAGRRAMLPRSLGSTYNGWAAPVSMQAIQRVSKERNHEPSLC
jgi:Predicted membrane protein